MMGLFGYGSNWFNDATDRAGSAFDIVRLVMSGFMMLFWIAILIVGVILLVKYLNRQNNQANGNHPQGQQNQFWQPQQQQNQGGRNPALDILDERYARGEIGDEEYLSKKANLK